MTQSIDSLWLNANLATMTPGAPYGAVENGALAVSGGRVAYAGPGNQLPADIRDGALQVHDAAGKWITPGLVDCHTHLIHAGNRAREFEMRLQGATYEEIARAGGGIISTVRATREATEEELYAQSKPRLLELIRAGATTIEIKSGYGLDLETELKMLRVASRFNNEFPISVQATYLGAHALPPEFAGQPDEYIDFVCDQVIPEIAKEGLAVAVDAFCEGIGFSPAQTERVFKAAQAHGLPVKLHAEQLSDLGGAALAAKYGALSVDHLEYLAEKDIPALAQSGTVAVLLPGAFYFLKETQRPPVEALRKAGVPMALATDANPGSSPTTNPLLMLNMGCTLFGLTPEEALAGLTINGAMALGLAATKGSLEPGKEADFVIWEIQHPAELAYRIGADPNHEVYCQGELIRI